MPSSKLFAIGPLLALALSAPTARAEEAEIASEDCTVARQCPKGGDSYTYLHGAKNTIREDFPKKGLVPRCLANKDSAIVTSVWCPAGEQAPKRGLCQRSAVSGAASDGSPWPIALGLGIVIAVVRGRSRRSR